MEVLDAQSYLADTPPGFHSSADVLLLLKDNKAVRMHSHHLACDSTVLNTLLAHLTRGEGKETRPFQIPFQEFSGNKGLTLLKILYAKQLELASIDSIDSAYTAARFAHKYDAPFLLKSADAYLSAHVSTADQLQVHAAGRPVPASQHAHMSSATGSDCIGKAPVGHTACAGRGCQRCMRL